MRISNHAPLDHGDELWRRLLAPTFRAGETYCLPRNVSKADALAYWCDPPHSVFVASTNDGHVAGTYFLTPNQPLDGGGGHVCNAGFITAPEAEGRGVARAMLQHAIDGASAYGYRAMQFNFVVCTNVRAIKTWERGGFARVGTLPGAFIHPTCGPVDAFVMFRELPRAKAGE